jgi:uncharacterized protein
VDVTLVLTHDCNLGCDYCYAGRKFKRAMTDEVMARALDLAFADDSEKVQVSFFGGEPLLAWDKLVCATLVAEELAATTGKRLVLAVTTNATLVDDARADFLVEHGFFVGVSIDGGRDAHDATRPTRGGGSSFDAVVAGLDALVARGAAVETISVVDPANVAHLGDTVRFLVGRGVERLALNPNFAADWSDAALAMWRRGYEAAADLYVERCLSGAPVYINAVEDKLVAFVKGGYAAGDRCAMGHGAVAVAPSGNLYPCERLVAEDDDDSVCVGDVWRGLDGGRRMVLDAQQGPVNDECGDCGVRERCASFCACANRAETGELGVAGGVQCWHEQMAIEVADGVGARLWKAKDRKFVARVYAWRAA